MIIQDNQFIILKGSKAEKVHMLNHGRSIKHNNVTIDCDSIIGKQFGFIFEVKQQQAIPVDLTKVEQDPLCQNDASNNTDNRKIVDDPNSQKLKQTDIHSLKEQGVSGEDIVDKLIENSATFKDKTSYSQSKYIKKKKQKHTGHIQVLQPSVRLLHQLLYSKSPAKVCMLRGDMLAQILTCTNVSSGSRVLVADTCQGLVAAAVLERLAGDGKLIYLHPGDVAHGETIKMLNMSGDIVAPLHPLPLQYMGEVREQAGLAPIHLTQPHLQYSQLTINEKNRKVKTAGWKRPAASNNKAGSGSGKCGDKKCKLDEEQRDETSLDQEKTNESCSEDKRKAANELEPAMKKQQAYLMEKNLEKQARREARMREVDVARELMARKDFNSLIVVSKYHPTSLVLHLIDFLKPSSNFAVFSPYREVLIDCFSKLWDRGGVICMKITENWYREYQMLPERSHPSINMNSSSGYLLTGVSVDSLRPATGAAGGGKVTVTDQPTTPSSDITITDTAKV